MFLGLKNLYILQYNLQLLSDGNFFLDKNEKYSIDWNNSKKYFATKKQLLWIENKFYIN